MSKSGFVVKQSTLDVLSPRPPPDFLRTEDLAAIVMGGPSVVQQLSDEHSLPWYRKSWFTQLAMRCLLQRKPKHAVTEISVVEDSNLIKNIKSPKPAGKSEKTDNMGAAIIQKESETLLTIKRPKITLKRPLLPPAMDEDKNKLCFLIDLDETLVHSSFVEIPNPDFQVSVEIEGKIHEIYVLVRPYCDLFLTKLGHLFECILFTASLSKYANPVTDFIDTKRIFRHRLFREHCVFFNGNYVKDLELMGRNVNQICILDNSPISFLFHNANAIQIISWFNNPHDRSLLELIPYFEAMSKTKNVPTFIMAHPPPKSACGLTSFHRPRSSSVSAYAGAPSPSTAGNAKKEPTFRRSIKDLITQVNR